MRSKIKKKKHHSNIPNRCRSKIDGWSIPPGARLDPIGCFFSPNFHGITPFVMASWFIPREDLAVYSTEATGLLPSSSDIFKAQNTLMLIHHPFVPWIHLRGRTFPDIGSLLVYVVPVYATSETTNTGVSHLLTFYYGSMHSDHHPKTGHFQHQMSLFCITLVLSYVWYPLHKL